MVNKTERVFFQLVPKSDYWRPPGTNSPPETEIPPTFPPTLLMGPPGTQKKTPGFLTPRGPVPSSLDPSTLHQMLSSEEQENRQNR